jgi:hypothetical protein
MIEVFTSFSGELLLKDSVRVSVVCFCLFSRCPPVVEGCGPLLPSPGPLLPSPGPFRFFDTGFFADDAFKFFVFADVFFAGLFCRALVGGTNSGSGFDRVFMPERSDRMRAQLRLGQSELEGTLVV